MPEEIVEVQLVTGAEGRLGGSRGLFSRHGIVHQLIRCDLQGLGDVKQRHHIHGDLAAFIFGDCGFALVDHPGQLLGAHVAALAIEPNPLANVLENTLIQNWSPPAE